MITQAIVKNLFHYSPETGIFKRTKSGKRVGHTRGRGGYLGVEFGGKGYYLHRLAWIYVYGELPEKHIDHINHVRSDNRIINLRMVTRSGNLKNSSKRKDNTSGVTGVHWRKVNVKWTAAIQSNGKLFVLGSYDDKFDAICARKSAENKHGFHLNHGQ